MQRTIKDAIEREADRGRCLHLCTVFIALALHTIAQGDSTPARFMGLLCFIDEAAGDPEAPQILTTVRRPVRVYI